ncbi:MAG: transposase [Tardiphaga sp.]|nr:transposase [Tardiphaga sp.]
MVAQNIVRHGSEPAYENGGTLGFSRVGKPTDNAFVESFSNRLRDEWLNTPWFADARAKIVAWRRDCNESRPRLAGRRRSKMLRPQPRSSPNERRILTFGLDEKPG